LGYLGFRVVLVQIGLDSGSSDLKSSWVQVRSDFEHFNLELSQYQVVWVQVGSGFRHSDLKLSQISDHLGSNRSSSDQFDFLQKIRSGSDPDGSGHILPPLFVSIWSIVTRFVFYSRIIYFLPIAGYFMNNSSV
jgi:hypothetical protein